MSVLVLIALVPFLALRLQAQQLSPDVLKLAKALNTNRDLLKQLPFYTCLETIDRSRPKSRGRPSSHDTVQVDVATIDKQEMYSWPGDTAFSQLDLPDLVGHGVISTGMFASFADNLFIAQHSIARFDGTDVVQGHDSLRFAFTVPSLESRWNINWEGATGVLGEEGMFWVDAKDFHLVRLQVTAHDIPPQIALRTLTLTMEYQITRGNSAPALVPIGAVLNALDLSNKPYRNTIAFSHCQVFQAESRISEDDQQIAAVLTHYKQKMGLLPSGLILYVALSEPLETRDAHVGEAISARLQHPVQVSSEVTIRAGAYLLGHIRQFEKLDDPPNSFRVGVEFSELEWGEKSYRFFATLERMQSLRGVSTELTSIGERQGSMRSVVGITREEVVSGAKIPGAASFFLSEMNSLPKGFQMTWKTDSLNRKERGATP